jgi:hypothetical protein
VTRYALGLIAGAAALFLIGIDAAYARHYFFLFDDFALVGQASTFPLGNLIAVPHFGFYRPVVFLLTKAEFQAFSWQHPAGYMAVALAIHGASATLLFGALRRFGVTIAPAAAAAVLFAASPWSSEAVFWMSGSFDVLSGFGTMVCLYAVLSLTAAENARQSIALGSVAIVSACTAILAKENVVAALPVLVVVSLVSIEGARARWQRWLVPVAIVTMEIAYLFVRNRLLPNLDGAYGTAASLYSKTPIVANVLGNIRALVSEPLPGAPPPALQYLR